MKNIKFNFIIVVIIIGLCLDGCSVLQSEDNDIDDGISTLCEEMIYEDVETAWDYLLEKDRVGKGVFLSEHLGEIETFIGQMLIEIIDTRGNIPKDKKHFFSDWATEQFSQINWEYIEKGRKVNSNIYEGKIIYNQDNCFGLLASTDAALSAEIIGKVITDVLENGSKETKVYRELFHNEKFFKDFVELKWEQIDDGWKVNCYYDCYCTYIYQKDGYVEFLYYFYPDYAAMNVKEAKAAFFKCTVGMEDGKIQDTSLGICLMTKEEYQTAREWKGEKITIVKKGEVAGGGGNLPIPVSGYNDEKEGYIYTNRDMGDYRLCDLIMEDFSSGNINSGKICEFLVDKKDIWLSDIADEIKDIIDDGWQIGQNYDFYYLNHNERAGCIHYRYYFYWNKENDEREKVLVTDAWISEEGLEEMELHCFFSKKNTENVAELKYGEDIIKIEDISAFLDYDWTAESVLMLDHIIQPEDSGQGWEFSIADIDFDGKQEMLISFPSNHCGGNSLYVYKQDNGNVFSYADTLATPKRCMVTGIDSKEKLSYMDIDMLDVYVNEMKEYRYLSVDCSSFGGDIHGGIYEIILYETVFGEEPKELVRINYCAPEEREELYFEGNKVYETGKLRDMLASYMKGYTKIAIDYQTANIVLPRDGIAISDQERAQQLDELYMSLKELVIE